MYTISYGMGKGKHAGTFAQSKYFHTYKEAQEYCDIFKWKYSRIKPVH